MDIPIIDAHLHIWDPRRLSYPWLADVPKINKPHLPEDYRAATTGLNIEKMVFLQCEAALSQFKDEVSWVTQQASEDARIRGIVAWAPLEQGEGARGDLEDLAKNTLVRGVRRIIQFEKDDRFCLRPDFVRGVQLLEEFDFSFDLCLKGDDQFKNVLELVRQCPRVRFILDHIGKPFIREGVMEPWKAHLKAISEMPNAWCKISGLVNEADLERWTADELKPYLDHVLACFGFDRVVFGGDWPVCTLATTYHRWVETLRKAVHAASDAERYKLFYANAAAFYRV